MFAFFLGLSRISGPGETMCMCESLSSGSRANVDGAGVGYMICGTVVSIPWSRVNPSILSFLLAFGTLHSF